MSHPSIIELGYTKESTSPVIKGESDPRDITVEAYTLNNLLVGGDFSSVYGVGLEQSLLVQMDVENRFDISPSLSPKEIISCWSGDKKRKLVCIGSTALLCDSINSLQKGDCIAFLFPPDGVMTPLSETHVSTHTLLLKSKKLVIVLVGEKENLSHTEQVISYQEFCELFPVPKISVNLPSQKTEGTVKVYGWLHVACMGSGDLIASELHGSLIHSGLFSRSVKIYVSLVGDPAMRMRLKEYLFSRHSKYEIIFDSDDLQEFEWPCLKHMWDKSRTGENFCAWYAHTKGASNCRPDVIARIQNNIRNWRYHMVYQLMVRYKESLMALIDLGYSASGPLFNRNCRGGAFAGNFWWASSEHLRTRKSPYESAGTLGENRGDTEGWIFQGSPGKFYRLSWSECSDPYDFLGIYGEEGPLGGTWC
jgi:hypothetical protein